MIRRPRFPLALRLAWLEREIQAASRLLPAMIADLKDVTGKADEADSRVAVLASLTGAALLLLGIDPALLQAFVDAMGPEGEPNEAEDLGAQILEQVFAMLADEEGSAH